MIKIDDQSDLNLVNLAYAKDLDDPLTMKLISESNPRIVERVKMYFNSRRIAGGEFDRYKVATYLLENFDTLKHDVSGETIKKISSLIERINGLLPSPLGTVTHGAEDETLELPDKLMDNRPKITM